MIRDIYENLRQRTISIINDIDSMSKEPLPLDAQRQLSRTISKLQGMSNKLDGLIWDEILKEGQCSKPISKQKRLRRS